MSQQPEVARLAVAVGDADHSQGSPNAPATLVEYGDYECPHCRRAYPIVKEMQRRLGPRLRFVFRNFPLTNLHEYAQHAAEVAEAAGAQGRYWEMHDRLFERQFALEDAHLIEYAAELGLDAARVTRELAAHTYKARVRDDFMSGVRSGVNGTPTFFVNGVRHDARWEEDTLLAALERAAPAAAGTGSAR
jgi:protein-disulfide isomerase